MKIDISTKAALVAALRKHYGYDGDNSNENIKAFIADPKNGVVLEDKFPLDEVLNKQVHIGYHCDAGETVKVGKLPRADDVGVDADSGPGAEGGAAQSAEKSASEQVTERKDASRFLRAQAQIFAPKIHGTTNKAAFERIRNKQFNPLGERNAGYVGDDLDTAVTMGAATRLWMAKKLGIDHYTAKREDIEICGKTLVESIGGVGAEWVAPEFSNILIANKSRYGAARKAAGVTPMRKEVLGIPDILSDVAPTWAGEINGTGVSAQDKPGTDRADLIATRLSGLVKVSREFLNDSQVDVAAATSDSFGRGMAKAEDDAYFNGDGTSTYGHFLGCFSSIGSAGQVTCASATAVGSVTDADVMNTMGTPADWVDENNCCFVGSRNTYFNVLNRLAATRGGVTYAEAQSGIPTLTYNGYPYYVTASMPSNPSAGNNLLLFGDFKRSTKFGEVVGSNELLTSDQRYFDEIAYAFLGTERVAISVHDAGDSSNAGGIALLKLHS